MNTRMPVVIMSEVEEHTDKVRELINYLKEKESEIGNLSAEDLGDDIKRMYERVA